MTRSLPRALAHGFLGQSPLWYKAVICLFLLLNPLLLVSVGPVAAGWALVLEFIFTLGMALKCYPLMPG
ncbi:sodium/proton antiporter, partial [Pseudomonas sp. CrR7]|nr:sodium/proton antiporter [Pseudomonas sp. CM27]